MNEDVIHSGQGPFIVNLVNLEHSISRQSRNNQQLSRKHPNVRQELSGFLYNKIYLEWSALEGSQTI